MAPGENRAIFHCGGSDGDLINNTKDKIMENRSQGEEMKNTAESMAEGLGETSEEIQNRLSDAWETGKERFGTYAQATDRAIREKPYQSIGIALGLGVLIGMLLNRRRISIED